MLAGGAAADAALLGPAAAAEAAASLAVAFAFVLPPRLGAANFFAGAALGAAADLEAALPRPFLDPAADSAAASTFAAAEAILLPVRGCDAAAFRFGAMAVELNCEQRDLSGLFRRTNRCLMLDAPH